MTSNFNDLIDPLPQRDSFAWCGDTGISHQTVQYATKWIAVCGAAITQAKIVGWAGWDNRPTLGTPCSDCYPRRAMSCVEPCGITECEDNGCAITALKTTPNEVVTPLLLLEEVKKSYECVECGPHNGCINGEAADHCIGARFLVHAIQLLKDTK